MRRRSKDEEEDKTRSLVKSHQRKQDSERVRKGLEGEAFWKQEDRPGRLL